MASDGFIIIQGVTLEDFMQELSNIIELKVEQAVRRGKAEEMQEKLLSPKETTKLFSPQISIVTLAAWEKAGKLNKHRIGGRTYYKYSEVMTAIATSLLKKYTRKS